MWSWSEIEPFFFLCSCQDVNPGETFIEISITDTAILLWYSCFLNNMIKHNDLFAGVYWAQGSCRLQSWQPTVSLWTCYLRTALTPVCTLKSECLQVLDCWRGSFSQWAHNKEKKKCFSWLFFPKVFCAFLKFNSLCHFKHSNKLLFNYYW